MSLQIAGECVEFKVNYDKLPSFVEDSLGQAKFWQILCQFVEALQVGKAYYTELILLNSESNQKTSKNEGTISLGYHSILGRMRDSD